MSDLQLNPGDIAGPKVRALTRPAVNLPVSAIDIGGNGPGATEIIVSAANPMPTGDAALLVAMTSLLARLPTALVGGRLAVDLDPADVGAGGGAHIVSAATANAAIVKASAGRVVGWALGNTSAAWQYVKLHNQATLPTAGAGVVRTIAIPPGGLAQISIPGGIGFATGIGMSIVTGSADADATATTAGAVVGELLFA